MTMAQGSGVRWARSPSRSGLMVGIVVEVLMAHSFVLGRLSG
jgi:hypothetical protein